MQIVALNWHIYLLTHSAFALGLIGFTRFVPITIFSLIGGTVADSHNRKRIMFMTQSLLTLFSAILAFVTFTNHISSILIYSMTIAATIALSFDMPARQAFIPSLVNKNDLANAMSLNTIMFQTSQIVGPTIAGFVIAKFGVGSVYFLNSLSFLAVLSALTLIHKNGRVEGQKVAPSFAAIKEGISFVKSKTIIWSTMLLDFFSTFFSSATSLLPIFARDILAVGPQGLGILYAAPSIGAVVSAYSIAHIGHIKQQGRILLTAITFYALGTIAFGFSHNYLLSLLSLIIIGAGDSISTIIRNTIRQLETPDFIRGRMTSVNMIFFMGGPQLGEFEAGVLAGIVGAPLSVIVGGVGTLIIVAVVTWRISLLRSYSSSELIE